MAETTDVQRLLVSLEANIKKYENTMRRASGIADTETTKIEKRISAGTKSIGGATSNLAAQFQDIAVQLQGGGSPLTVALQQGTQISAVLGQQGAAGAVKLLGSAFASVISPVSLLTIGVIALGGAAFKWLTSATAETESLDDKIKDHNALVKDLVSTYGEAGKGLDDLVRKNSDVIETLVRGSIVKLQEQYKKLATDASASLSQVIVVTDALGQSDWVDVAERKFGVFKAAIDRLRDGVKAGSPDVAAFRNEVAGIEKTTSDEKVRKLAQELLAATDEASKVDDALKKAQRAIEETGRIASGEVARLKEFGDALSDLSKIGLPKLDDRAKAAEVLQKGLAGASGNKGRINAVESEYIAALGRIGQREKEENDKRAAEEAKRDADRLARRAASNQRQYEQDLERVKKSTDVLNLEFEMIGKTEQERDKARMVLNLEAEARKLNIDLTDQQRSQIDQLATAYAAAAEKARLANEVMMEIKNFGSAASEAFKGLVLEGKKFDEVLAQLLNRLASRGIDKIFDSIFSSIGGSLFGGSGGFLSSLFGGGKASGGDVSAGTPYIVGERGKEVFVPKTSGTIVPNDMVRKSGSGDINVTVVSNPVFQAGMTPTDMASIQVMLRESSRQTQVATIQAIRAGQRATSTFLTA